MFQLKQLFSVENTMIMANYSLTFLNKVDLCPKLAVWSVFLPCIRGLPLRLSELRLC